jgi:O-acetylhomoserine (thiol)-lyase
MSNNSTPDRDFGFATRALHAGQQPDPARFRAVPIYQTTSYAEDTQHAIEPFNHNA